MELRTNENKKKGGGGTDFGGLEVDDAGAAAFLAELAPVALQFALVADVVGPFGAVGRPPVLGLAGRARLRTLLAVLAGFHFVA